MGRLAQAPDIAISGPFVIPAALSESQPSSGHVGARRCRRDSRLLTWLREIRRADTYTRATYTHGVQVVYERSANQHRNRGHIRPDDHGPLRRADEDRGRRSRAAPPGRAADDT